MTQRGEHVHVIVGPATARLPSGYRSFSTIGKGDQKYKIRGCALRFDTDYLMSVK